MRSSTFLRPGLAVSLTLLAPAVFAQEADEVVHVTAARIPVPAGDATASITRLDSAALEARGAVFVADALRAVPGMAVSRSGSAGALTQIRARGAEANHVLLLVDGIEAASPFTGEADFAHFALDDIASIEVARGEQSALWGADAIGGVVRINTLRPDEGEQVSARLEGGSLSTYRASGRFASSFDGGGFAISGGHFQSDGIDVSGLGGETETYESRTLAASGDYALNTVFRLEAAARWIGFESGFDSDLDFDGRLDNADLVADGDRVLARTALLADHEAGAVRWSHELAVQLTDEEVTNLSAGTSTGRSLGQRLQGHYQVTARWQAGDVDHRLTGLLERDQDRLKSVAAPGAGSNQTRQIDSDAIALDYGLGAGALDINLSARRDANEAFDDSTTWRAGAGWTFDAIGGRVHASIGEGVKNPGIFELYGFFPAFFTGNPDLQPERSRGWELGWTQALAGDRGSFSAVWFSSELEDEIYTDFGVFPFTARNRASASERQGLELEGHWEFSGDISAFGALTLLESEENGAPEIRRPETLASLTLDWHPQGSDLSGALTIDHTGEQRDTDFGTFQPVVLDAYTLIGGQLRWQANDRVELYARGENLFDEEYQDVFGFHTAGRGLYLGLRLRSGR